MKALIILIASLSAFSQTTVISDTLTAAVGGGNWTGRVIVSLNSPGSATPLYYSTTSLAGWQQTICIGVTGSDCTVTTAAGVITLTVYTNDVITPSGTSYRAQFQPQRGEGWMETWVVAAGNTKLYQIRATRVPTPTTTFSPSQMSSGGATTGQYLRWSGTAWAPYTFAGLSDPTTTTGDIIYRNSGGTLSRLGVGSSGQVLTVAAGLPSWAAASGGVSSITGTANQIAASASTGAVTLSIPNNPTLPGTTTGTFSGNLTGNVTGNVSGNAGTATALASALGADRVLFGDGTGVPATDQYWKYVAWPGSPVAGTTFNRMNITDASPPSGGYYDTNAGYDISIRRTYTALPYTPSAPVVNSVGGIYLHQSFDFTAPVSSEYLSAVHAEVEVPNTSSQAISYLEGAVFNVGNYGSGTVNAMDGLYFSAYNYGSAATSIRGIYGGGAHLGTGNVSALAGMSLEGYNYSATVVSINQGMLLYSGMAGGGGSITTAYGIRNRFDTTGTIGTAYAYQSTRIGSTSPTTAWDISAETGFNSRLLGKLAVGPSNSTAPTVTMIVRDATTTTGDTSMVVQAGPGQASALQAWQDTSATVLFKIASDGIPQWTSIAEPTCNSSNRGKVTMVQGGAGVADTFRICVKASDDSYYFASIL